MCLACAFPRAGARAEGGVAAGAEAAGEGATALVMEAEMAVAKAVAVVNVLGDTTYVLDAVAALHWLSMVLVLFCVVMLTSLSMPCVNCSCCMWRCITLPWVAECECS